MEQKVLLKVLILLLGFSYVLSLVAAAPLSRSLKLVGEASSSTNQELVVMQDFMEETGNYDEVILKGEEEGFLIHGRMVAENNDYPDTGANKNHLPKPPRT